MATSVTLSAHTGPNKEEKNYNTFEKKAEKAKRPGGKQAELDRENWEKLEVTGVSKERD